MNLRHQTKHPFAFVILLILFISSCSQPGKDTSTMEHTARTVTAIVPKNTKEPVVKPLAPFYRTVLSPAEVAYASFLSPIENYNTEKGLALSTIACSFRDHNGNLWFGTYGGGVSCYNGKSFVNYTLENGLPSNDIRSICEDKKGNLWFGTWGFGASCFNGRTFTNYAKEQGVLYPYIAGLVCDARGNVWMGGWGGLHCFDGKKITRIDTTTTKLKSMVITCLCTDKEGRVWGGLDGEGAFRYDGKNFKNYTVNGDTLVSNNIQSICADKKGNIWFGSDRNGFAIYDGKKFNNLAWSSGSVNNDVRSIYADKDGNVWLGTGNGGVWVYYNGNTTDYNNFTTTNGLTSVFLTTITQDGQGNMWFGSNGGGVDCYSGKALINFGSAHGLPMDQVYACHVAKDKRVWIGTHGGGLSIYDQKNFNNYGIAQGLFATSLTDVAEDDQGNFWIATSGWGIINVKGDSLLSYSKDQGLTDGYCSRILLDKAGNVWVATTDGLSKFDGQTFTNYNTEQGLAHKDICDMVFDPNGVLWLATRGNGISRFENGKFSNYSTKEGLPGPKIISIETDAQGNIWCGTDGYGVSVFNGKQFINYSTAHGLPNNTIKDIVRDIKDNIWLGTNMGLVRINPQEVVKATSSQQEELSVDIFNSQTGFPIKNIFAGSMCADEKGVIWVGTGDKLIRFDPALAAHKAANPPVIQSVKVNRENVSWYNLKQKKSGEVTREDSLAQINEEISIFGKPLSHEARELMTEQYSGIEFDTIHPFNPIPTNLVLPYADNNVSFEFCAVQPSKSFLVKYQYMLEGYDDDWCSPVARTSAAFGNMAEGSYIFKVKALAPGGTWSEPVSYRFTVVPPWYRTWWAFVLFGGAGIAAIWLFMRWRTAALEQRQLILEKTVQERTAEVVHQKEIIEEKQKEILDSIYYAKRIQTSLMSHPAYIEKSLNRLKN